jgi:lipopolysaccharide/colanic/teichoic acid biosynthesis glycosyltransferase
MLGHIEATAPWTLEAVAPPRDWFTSSVFKRLVDLVFASMVLFATLPIWLVIAVAIKLDSRGPVFFIQERVGRNGRRFQCLKFRTMQIDAEARLEEMRRRGEVQGMVFKIRHDPRVTRVGRLLRRASLDELPQLVHVVKGEMSLVGPRPLIPSQIQQFSAENLIRLRVKPGLTCLWAVRGRSDSGYEAWMAADREYVLRHSALLDLAILFKTIVVVATCRGAY